MCVRELRHSGRRDKWEDVVALFGQTLDSNSTGSISRERLVESLAKVTGLSDVDALLLASGVSQSGDVDCGAFFQWHFCEPLVVIDRRVTVPSTPNWNVLLEGCRNAVLFCHGGCPDGFECECSVVFPSSLVVQRGVFTCVM